MGEAKGHGLLPGLADGFAEKSGNNLFVTELGHESCQQGLPTAHGKRDQIYAPAVVVVARVAWTIGGYCHLQKKAGGAGLRL